jgi:hypothetical protein
MVFTSLVCFFQLLSTLDENWPTGSLTKKAPKTSTWSMKTFPLWYFLILLLVRN